MGVKAEITEQRGHGRDRDTGDDGMTELPLYPAKVRHLLCNVLTPLAPLAQIRTSSV